jgi:Ca2+-binding RTX toxin-like protein
MTLHALRHARVGLPAIVAMCGVSVALTAGMVVPSSSAGHELEVVTVNGLKPAACAAITLNGIRTGSGTFNDTGQPHLVLGSAGADTIRGLPGNDCIVGGAGNDMLRGDQGTDVCIGGPGTDTFNTCEVQIQ